MKEIKLHCAEEPKDTLELFETPYLTDAIQIVTTQAESPDEDISISVVLKRPDVLKLRDALNDFLN